MRDNFKNFPVNWVDGMKISKDHLLATDNAWRNAIFDSAAVGLSPIRFGILPPSVAGENTFNVHIAVDNQHVLRVSILSCQAITPGGVRVLLPTLGVNNQSVTDGLPSTSLQLPTSFNTEASIWVVLVVHPFQNTPAGSPDTGEMPPRYPFVVPTFAVEIVNESQYSQFNQHPYAIFIGKLLVGNNGVRVDDDYIPPCYSISSHPDLVGLHSELDKFLATLELQCSQIVQKIYRKNQKNDISELVLFLCDRIMLHLAPVITQMRWIMIHESPALLFAAITSLARVIKNTIDLRIGSGKEEMMNYFSEWSELKQGELENMLAYLATLRFDNNDVNANIQKIISFVMVITGLFETLGKLEFIGKKKESGIFVTEGNNSSFSVSNNTPVNDANKPKRRFFG